MKKLLVYIVVFFAFNIESSSQIIFETGYFINDSNQKIDCLIKNVDWKNNPIEFEYKLSQNDSVQKGTIQTVKEFGINGISKYIRAKVKIDRSSNDINKMSLERNPEFQEELLFLKALLDGKASLFLYTDGTFSRLFYKLTDTELNQLIYKPYLTDNNIAYNNSFRQQLFLDLKCQGISLNEIANIKYNQRNIERIFIKYNECTNSLFTNYNKKQKKDMFNLSLRPGVNYSSLDLKNSHFDSWNTDFGNAINFRFGVEAEILLPFNKNKWAIITEPTFQYYKSNTTNQAANVYGGVIASEITYKSIELPTGIRHYFFLNDKSKIFVNVSYTVDFSIKKSFVEFTRNDGSLLNTMDVKPRPNLAFGMGYKHKDKYSIEMRYQTSRELMGDFALWNSNYTTFAIILGYSLF